MNENYEIFILNAISALAIDLKPEECLLEEEIKIIKGINKFNFGVANSGVNVLRTNSFLEDYKLDRLAKLFDGHINFYVSNILGVKSKFERVHSWLTVNQNETNHHIHNHRNAMITAVLYFDENLTDNLLAPLKLYVPGLNSTFNEFKFKLSVNEDNIFNYEWYKIYPKTNRLIIFPAHLHHETERVKTDTKRYAIGVNYFLSDKVSFSEPKSFEEINVKILSK